MTERVGQRLGHYQLQRLLGQGGFADVYLGEHIHLKNVAAIKVLHTRLTEETQKEFLREAQMLARLLHPHIIRVLDFGIDNGVPYLVMDYAPGGTLRQRHRSNTKLALTTVVDYVQQIGEGLQYAHDQKLIHRDLKPENVLIGSRSDLHLSDFGVALMVQSARSKEARANLAGTASYIAPEQLSGKPEFASDQYALGIMVYEWLCGTRPFKGSLLELYSQHYLKPPPPLREHVPELPEAIERVVLKAIAKGPEQRYKSVKDFADALKIASESTQIAGVFQNETLLIQEPVTAPMPISQPESLQTPAPISQAGLSQTPTPILQPGISQVPISISQAGLSQVPTPILQPGISQTPVPISQAGLSQMPTPISRPDLSQVPIPAIQSTRPLPAGTPSGEQSPFMKSGAGERRKRPPVLKIFLLAMLALVMILGSGAAAFYAFSKLVHEQIGKAVPARTAQATVIRAVPTVGGQAVVVKSGQVTALTSSAATQVSSAPRASSSVAPTSIATNVVSSTPVASSVASKPVATSVAPTPTAVSSTSSSSNSSAKPTVAAVAATPTPTPTAIPTPTPTPMSTSSCPATIEFHSKGTLVSELQNSLNSAYNNGSFSNSPYNFSPLLVTNGVFESKTQAAVEDYQSAKGLTVNGVVGQETWHALGYC